MGLQSALLAALVRCPALLRSRTVRRLPVGGDLDPFVDASTGVPRLAACVLSLGLKASCFVSLPLGTLDFLHGGSGADGWFAFLSASGGAIAVLAFPIALTFCTAMAPPSPTGIFAVFADAVAGGCEPMAEVRILSGAPGAASVAGSGTLPVPLAGSGSGSVLSLNGEEYAVGCGANRLKVLLMGMRKRAGSTRLTLAIGSSSRGVPFSLWASAMSLSGQVLPRRICWCIFLLLNTLERL